MVSQHISRWWHNTFVYVALILAVGLIIYSGIYSAPFVYDDFVCILTNPAICDFNFVKDISSLNNLLLNEDIYKNIVLRPLGYLTFAINFHFGGFNVVGYHIFNIVVHLLNALLVCLTIRLTLDTQSVTTDKSGRTSFNISNLIPLFAALLFVSHPLQTQSVTYITQRFTSLATLFFLLSLAMYIKAGLSQTLLPRSLFYAASFIAACAAMKTKEIAFTLPLIIIVYEFTFFSNNLKHRLVKLFPFMLTMLIIPISVLKLNTIFSKAADLSVGKSMNLVNYAGISKWEYLISQFRVIVTYIRLLLLPINQSLEYDVPVYRSFFHPSVSLSFALISALLGSGFYLLNRSKKAEEPRKILLRLIAFGILWFFVTLSVESSLIPLDDLLVEQRVYLPSFGFILAFVASVAIILESRQRAGITVFAWLCTFLVIVLSITAYSRNLLWMDPIALWSDTAKKNPARPRAYQNLGAQYFGKRMFQESIVAFSTAQRLDPGKIEATANLASIYFALNRFDEAESEYLKALRIDPDNEKLNNDLAKLYVTQNRHSKAMPLLQYLVRVNPYSPDVHVKLAELYEATGHRDQAVAEYMSAYRLAPNDFFIISRLNQLNGK